MPTYFKNIKLFINPNKNEKIFYMLPKIQEQVSTLITGSHEQNFKQKNETKLNEMTIASK